MRYDSASLGSISVAQVPGFDNAAVSWADRVAVSHNDGRVNAVMGAVVSWVEALGPENNLNQCLPASNIIKMFIETVGLPAEVCPSVVSVSGGKSQLSPGSIGSEMPGWSEDGAWKGHCVVWLPFIRWILDPTIGQWPGFDGQPIKLRLPVVARLSRHEEILSGSLRFRVPRDEFRMVYRILPQECLPSADTPVVKSMNDDVDRLRMSAQEKFRAKFGDFGSG